MGLLRVCTLIFILVEIEYGVQRIHIINEEGSEVCLQHEPRVRMGFGLCILKEEHLDYEMLESTARQVVSHILLHVGEYFVFS